MKFLRRTPLAAMLALAALPSFGAYAAPADGGALPAIRPLMALRPLGASSTEVELLIYGDIGDSWWGESVTALAIVQQLQALDASVTQINVRINSYGGSVSDGIAIYNALKRHSARKVVTVDGVAMSSASLIAMAGDEVQMPSASLLMIHAPWGYAQGNAQDMRVMAEVLDTYASAMAGAYASKTGKPKADMLALLEDGKDHYYTGDQAVTEGFADKMIDPLADQTGEGEGDAAARAAGVSRLLADAPENIRQIALAAAARHPTALPKAETPRLRVPAGLDMPSLQTALASASGQRALVTALTTAASAEDGDLTMKLRKLFAAMAAVHAPATDPADGGQGGGGGSPAPSPNAAFVTAMRERNDSIRAALEPYMAREGISELLVQALADPSMTLDQVREKALAKVGAGSEPLNGGSRIEMGADSRDKMRAAGEQILLARAGVITGADAERARQGNPFARATLTGMAETLLIQAGVDTRSMSREDIARRALAVGQSTGDFPVLLENVLHKTLVGGYNTAAFTWNRFCATGTLSDYRPHNRYHLSSFSDLLPAGESGEYKDGTLGDGEKETIVGKRKGRILNITPEVLINDDLGAFTRLAQTLGQAAGRTIEKDVYALFAMNGGNGPTMSDGKALFHADHGNIATAAAAPTVTSIDAMRQQLAQQKDPGGNDFLDLMLAVFLGPLSLGGEARVLNEAQYDPSVSNKFQVPNRVRGLFRDVVDTPRLSGTAWYGIADAGMEPVFEVAFLDGVQTPTLQQETNFRTDGLAWKVVHRYGVAAVGYRGIVKNAGA